MSMNPSLFDEPLDVLTSYLKPGGTVLDVGAKDGFFSQFFSRKGYQVTALDPKPAFPSLFKMIPSSLETFESKSTYDLVFARLVEHLMKGGDLCKNIQKLVRLVAPGGLLYFTFFGPKDPWTRTGDSQLKAEACFRNNHLKIILSEEKEFDKATYAGEQKHWHIFTYLLKKEI